MLDTRFFIPAYGAVFAASCVLLGLRDFAAAIPLAVLAGLLAAAGIAFDLAENRRTQAALDRHPEDEAALAAADAGARATRRASLAKWLCLSVTTALLSASFLAEGDWWYAVGGAYLAAGAAGIAAVLANLGDVDAVPGGAGCVHRALRGERGGARARDRAGGSVNAKGLHRRPFEVDPAGLEPATFWLPARRSPS